MSQWVVLKKVIRNVNNKKVICWLELPNIIELGTDDISKQQWKNHVKKAVRSSFEEEAKIKIKQLKKLSEGPYGLG